MRNNKGIEITKDGPIDKVLKGPQLMFHRHMGFSSFYRMKEHNKRVDQWWEDRKKMKKSEKNSI